MPLRIGILRILKRPQIIRYIALAWILLVVVGSFQPIRILVAAGSLPHAGLRAAVGSLQMGRPPVGGSLHPTGTGPVVGLHREIHWLSFGGAAFLLLLLSRNRRQEIRSVIATCLLGLSLEYMQHLVYYIDLEWPDVYDDTLAAIVALALYRLACKYTDIHADTCADTCADIHAGTCADTCADTYRDTYARTYKATFRDKRCTAEAEALSPTDFGRL